MEIVAELSSASSKKYFITVLHADLCFYHPTAFLMRRILQELPGVLSEVACFGKAAGSGNISV
jgi:hypothetical protein